MLERLSAAVHLQELSGLGFLDVLVLAVIIYQLLLLIRGTRAVQMMVGVVALVVAHFLTRPGLINLPAVHAVLGTLLLYIPFAVVVLFQNPIRQALARVGRNPIAALIPRPRHENLAEEIALASVSLASKRLGALIVIERELGLRAFYETGIAMDALISYDLLLNIFTYGSPLHDGAAILSEGRIKAAACYLPLTMDPSLSRTYGTRHRAAIGITEESDALAVVVSEERAIVSLAEGGRIVEDLDAHGLAERLRLALLPRPERKKDAAAGRPASEGAPDA
jgi:diadenylate cyclase